MPIEFKDGDIFATKNVAAYAHGCNCAGAMGKGIAIEFKKRWPLMYAEYKRRCANNSFVLGDIFVWTENGKTIINLGTQKSWRSKATLCAIESAISKLIEFADDNDLKEVYLPAIGAGLGGLGWLDVKELITELSAGSNVTLIVCENYIAGQAIL